MNRTDCWSAAIQRLPEWDPPAVPTLVVVPHPDDEVLMTAGLISRQREEDVDVTVLAVTDGEHAYPGRIDPSVLALLRQAEQHEALRQMGVSRVIRLGLVDGSVADDLPLLRAAIDALLPEGPSLLVAPWVGDHHTDHEACGRAAASVRAARRQFGMPGDLAHGLFWTYHHRSPSEVPVERMARMTLDPAGQARRWAALRCHASQVSTAVDCDPVLSGDVLAPMQWPSEQYVVAG